jgi:hypothetical protein
MGLEQSAPVIDILRHHGRGGQGNEGETGKNTSHEETPSDQR